MDEDCPDELLPLPEEDWPVWMRTTRASLALPDSHPATNTRSPLNSALLEAALEFCLITEPLARVQVQVVPFLALTMRWPLLTDWMVPRSKANVLVPLEVL